MKNVFAKKKRKRKIRKANVLKYIKSFPTRPTYSRL